MIQEEIIDELNAIGQDYWEYFKTCFTEIQKIFSWYRIQLRIISIEQTTLRNTPGYISDYFQTEIHMAYVNRKEKNSDFTLFFYNSNPHLDYFDRYVFFCRKNSMQMIYFPKERYMDKRLLLEMVVENFFDSMLEYMNDDNYEETCKCAYKSKIMCFSSIKRLLYTRDHWPPKIQMNCEIEYLIRLLFKSPCLFEKHVIPNLFVSCGNGVLDLGEQCDCGHEFQCNHTGQEECCFHDTCQFKNRSFQCSYGECCENCRFAQQKVCRKKYGECDLDEMCTGNSSECPPDIIYENYALCNNNEGFCWNGMCTDHKSMCHYVYDNDDISFNQKCYDDLLKTIKSLCNQENVPINVLTLCKITDICNYFICATRRRVEVDNFIFIQVSDVDCFIPTNFYLTGALAYSPNYVKCSNKIDHFCHYSKCISDKNVLKNCYNNICYSINNNLTYPMTKNIPLYSHGFQYMNIGIYSLVKEKIFIPTIIYKPPIGLYILIFIPIIVLIIALGYYTKRCQKNAFVHKKNNLL